MSIESDVEQTHDPENKGEVEEDEDMEEETGTFCAITFISQHANALRTKVHL